MSDAVILRDGDRLIPRPEARAGWYAGARHGGPAGAIDHGLQAHIDRANSFGS